MASVYEDVSGTCRGTRGAVLERDAVFPWQQQLRIIKLSIKDKRSEKILR